MAKKEFTYRGKTLEELQKLSVAELLPLLPSRARRSIIREDDETRKLREKILKRDRVRTHRRELVVLPNMLGKTVQVHMGKEFVPVLIQPEMIGHRLGEFALTRKRVAHNSPGVGATRSSANVSVK